MDDNFMMPLQAGEAFPFMGRLIDLERSDDAVVLKIPYDMLDNAGISKGNNKVEVWREISDGTICFRIATRCEICKRGARLYELETGFGKKNLCAEDYFAFTGQRPPQETPTTENIAQTEQP
ncbi:hypothetical protein D0U04_25150 [Bacillus clarus]|uniref:Uncharacterized protein n=1 Tax=Bacillus clarus TaxID=2338372 RepID=A0A090YM61_9BACI|nr:hypothetical protein [Bacillus clarus]KFM99913.1 hypothetical protein DJ93_340 [Bacillus clarus]RFT63478.1 hypothetical protein D0U04_25150 [Bacillus clarus]